MGDLLESFLSDDTAKVASEVLVASTEASVEDQAWAVADVLLDTGAAEGIALLFGAPAVVIVALRGFKSYRKRKRGTHN